MEMDTRRVRWLNYSTLAMIVVGTLLALWLSPGPRWLWVADHCPAATTSCTAMPLGLIGVAVGLAGVRAAVYLAVVPREVMTDSEGVDGNQREP